jgi:hypothetical protein
VTTLRGWPYFFMMRFRNLSAAALSRRDAGLQRCDTAAVKSLRHRRTVSSRTPNAAAILELVQPASVKNTARARSASLRSRESARANRPARCSSLAVTGDFPAMPYTLRIGPGSEPRKKPIRWLAKRNLLSFNPKGAGRKRAPRRGPRRLCRLLREQLARQLAEWGSNREPSRPVTVCRDGAREDF